METARREYRIWVETGDLMGCASVYKRRAWWTVELEPFLTAEKVRTKGFRNEQDAYDFAQATAERYMAEAIAWEIEHYGKTYPEDDQPDWSDAFSIQIVEAE
jgi:hypothetical protein